MIAAQTHYVATYLATGSIPQRRGTEGNGGLPSQVFPCQDAGVVVICGTEAQFKALCEVLRRPELASDPRFETNAKRVANRHDLTATFNALTETWQSRELISALMAAGVPCGPTNTYEDVFSDPQVVHRNIVQEADHPTAGKVRLCASPIKFSAHAESPNTAPPVMGQHTHEVLQQVLGYRTEDLADLQASNAI